jgi:hypothetical protein
MGETPEVETQEEKSKVNQAQRNAKQNNKSLDWETNKEEQVAEGH